MTTTPIEGWRQISWEIGTAEFQRSTLASETFALLHDFEQLSASKIRDVIRRRRKLIISKVITGLWSRTPSERFVNEHAWVLSKMVNPYQIAECVNEAEHIYRLLPDGEARMPDLLAECRHREPWIWRPSSAAEAS
jgi:hypothetical protein